MSITHFIYRLLKLSILTSFLLLIGSGFIFYRLETKSQTFPTIKIPIVNKSIVNVGGVCSGVIVQHDYVITAAHCVHYIQRTKLNPIKITFFDYHQEYFDIRYVGDLQSNTNNDYAILYGNTRGLPQIILADQLPDYFTKIWHMGYGGTLIQWQTPGIYLGRLCPVKVCQYYYSCRVIPGDSGGPMVSSANIVVGIAYSSYWPIDVALGSMVPAKFIRKKMQDLGIFYSPKSNLGK